MNIDDAIQFVLENGYIIEKARLKAIFFEEPVSNEVIDELSTFQNKDGGFSFWIKDVSNICDTVYILFWFDDLKIYRNRIVETACQFLLDRQKSDGSWDEVKDVVKYNSPEWLIPSKIETKVRLTAYCAHVLICFGYAEAEGTRCPSKFLLKHMNKSGRLTGYLRATWIALPMLAFFPGVNSEPFERALNLINSKFSKNWEGSYIGWLLRCLYDAGLPLNNPLVIRCIDTLESCQRKDGSWEPEKGEGEEHAVNATLLVLRTLKEYRYI